LNLNMPADRIKQLAEYGKKAGRAFAARFGDPQLVGEPDEPSMNWDNHQRIRLRLLLASLSETLGNMLRAHEQTLAAGAPYTRFFDPDPGGKSGAYPWAGRAQVAARDPASKLPVSQAGLGKSMYELLLDLARTVRATIASNPGQKSSISPVDPMSGAPRPVPEAKLRPRI
jgi:hypothetical protein